MKRGNQNAEGEIRIKSWNKQKVRTKKIKQKETNRPTNEQNKKKNEGYFIKNHVFSYFIWKTLFFFQTLNWNERTTIPQTDLLELNILNIIQPLVFRCRCLGYGLLYDIYVKCRFMPETSRLNSQFFSNNLYKYMHLHFHY